MYSRIWNWKSLCYKAVIFKTCAALKVCLDSSYTFMVLICLVMSKWQVKNGISLSSLLAVGSSKGYIVSMCVEWVIMRLNFDLCLHWALHVFWVILFGHVICNPCMDKTKWRTRGLKKTRCILNLWFACLLEWIGVEMGGSYYRKTPLFIML